MAMSVTYANFCGRIVAENRGGTVKTYGRDTLGNTVALRDIHQNKTNTLGYWPYGEVATRTGTTPTPFQFGGTLGYYMFYMQVIALVYVRARTLMTIFGGWTSVDPLWPSELTYPYANANPLTLTDPHGMQVLECAAAGSFVCPGIGTAVGAVVGGEILGGIIGFRILCARSRGSSVYQRRDIPKWKRKGIEPK